MINLMALSIEELKKHILEAIPDASIEIKDLMGDNNHYSAIVRSKVFKGVNRVDHKAGIKSRKAKWVTNYMLFLLLQRKIKWI